MLSTVPGPWQMPRSGRAWESGSAGDAGAGLQPGTSAPGEPAAEFGPALAVPCPVTHGPLFFGN